MIPMIDRVRFRTRALIHALDEFIHPSIRRHSARLIAIALVLTLYAFTRLPEASRAERKALARNIHFTQMALPEIPGPPSRTFRQVNPSLQRIAAWVSSVGASVALNDLDGNGLPDDVCYVDPRTDRVIVAPVPGTSPRYQPFTLDPGPGLFNPATMAPMGCLPGDLNEDGLMDILVYYWGRTPVMFLRKNDPETNRAPLSSHSYVPQEVVPGGARWYTNAATFADLDGDGHLDLILGNYYQDGARILDATASTTEEMQHSMSRAFNGGGSRFLRWEGATTGTEPSVRFKLVEKAIAGDEAGEISHGWTLAVGAADLDGDLLPEVYFANDFGPDRLLHNRSKPGEFHFVLVEGRKRMTTPSSKVLGHDSFKGMGVDFGDLNGDGVPDIVVSNITDDYALEESNFVFISTGETALLQRGIAPYVDRSEALGLSRGGWAWDVKLGDFTNEGKLEVIQATGFADGATNRWPELHELAMGNDQLLQHPSSWPRLRPGDDALSNENHNRFFIPAANGRYCDISAELGLDTHQITRGISTADVDGDGRLDFAIANQWGASYFYHNESVQTGAFLGLHLRLPVRAQETGPTKICRGHTGTGTPTLPAIGAQVSVQLPDGRRLVGQVDGGNGHSGKRSPDLHFGLGALPPETSMRAVLRWRDLSGDVHMQALHLSPGWYTVILGQGEEQNNDCA